MILYDPIPSSDQQKVCTIVLLFSRKKKMGSNIGFLKNDFQLKNNIRL